VNQTRNLCVYPNVFLMDQFSTQIRVVRPLAVDKTEVSIFCFAPKGESDGSARIRQYEDFFNVSGMGTADDLEEFRACQAGYAGTPRCGTTCRAARRCGSTGRTRTPRRWG
jgi:benzoate/toluate 1,2-dioxygenase alpha subunit